MRLTKCAPYYGTVIYKSYCIFNNKPGATSTPSSGAFARSACSSKYELSAYTGISLLARIKTDSRIEFGHVAHTRVKVYRYSYCVSSNTSNAELSAFMEAGKPPYNDICQITSPISCLVSPAFRAPCKLTFSCGDV